MVRSISTTSGLSPRYPTNKQKLLVLRVIPNSFRTCAKLVPSDLKKLSSGQVGLYGQKWRFGSHTYICAVSKKGGQAIVNSNSYSITTSMAEGR